MIDNLRVAVLGVGMMGSFHVEALSRRVRGATVTVISDFDAERAAALAGAVPGARVDLDPLAAINADDVDAVVIASPGPAHEQQVLACLERRIPVLCEKPLTPEVDTARKIVEAEARTGRALVQLGFMRRFDPEYVEAKELITSGAIGSPLLVHCVHRNMAAGPHFNSAMMVTDSVVHEADVARFLLEEEIVSVQVLKPTATSAAPNGYSDPMMVIFATESGRLVTVEIFVRTGVGYEVRTEIVGERGSTMFGLDQHGITKTSSDSGGRWGGAVPAGFVERFAGAYERQLQRWADAARTGTIDGPGAWDGYAAVAVCAAGVQAVHSGAVVPVELGPRPNLAPADGAS
jgi:myo-inositol 2-dehydrogenase/D-chiro-inositol 1-dehydrogenase